MWGWERGRRSKMISNWWQKRWSWQEPLAGRAFSLGSQREFETDFFEAIARRQADYWEVLALLGNHYTAAKRYKDGLAVDERLASLRPTDAIVYYNLACSYSLVGRLDFSLAALEKALALGYRDFAHIMRDRDLDALRKDDRFRSLLSKYVKV